RVFQHYAVNWLPFPDGALQFSVSYTESLSSEGDETKTLSPTVRWRIARGIFLTTSYSQSEGESDTEVKKSKLYSANLRILL
ncbi:MAG: hypothetical protein ACYTFZ_08275, partial [Planctomycetota bacterium]